MPTKNMLKKQLQSTVSQIQIDTYHSTKHKETHFQRFEERNDKDFKKASNFEAL